MSSINPNRNGPIEPLKGGGGSKEEEKPSVSHPFEEADPAIASVAAGALGGAQKATKAHEVTSDFFDYASSGVETVEGYLSLCLQRVRTHLVEKAQLRIDPEIGKNVLLLLTPLAGFGDILFIYKAAQALKAESFNVSIRIVEVEEECPLKVKKQLEKMANMEDIEVLTPDSGESDVKPDCVIIAPTIPEDEVIDEVVKPLGVPFEKIYEYGGNRTSFNPFSNFFVGMSQFGEVYSLKAEEGEEQIQLPHKVKT